MANPYVNTEQAKRDIEQFFSDNRRELTAFGNTVNQTVEAFVFASVVNWYKKNGWTVELQHPKDANGFVKLKFNTRSAPQNYTYARCIKGTEVIQVRHNLRVATQSNLPGQIHKANVVLDVPVIADTDLSKFKTNDHLDNGLLLTFGEAKHMSAFAELIANFIGLVHELSPTRLANVRLETASEHPVHLAPFLYVSGLLYPSAQGIVETIRNRGFDIDVYDYKTGLDTFELGLQVTFPKKKDIAGASNVFVNQKSVLPDFS